MDESAREEIIELYVGLVREALGKILLTGMPMALVCMGNKALSFAFESMEAEARNLECFLIVESSPIEQNYYYILSRKPVLTQSEIRIAVLGD